MPSRKNYDIHGHTRVNAMDLAELATYYTEKGEKYKVRSLGALLRSAVEDLAQAIRDHSEDSRKLHPDDAIETLEILGILPRSTEFLLGKFKEIKKRDTSRLNEIQIEKEYHQALNASIHSNTEELTGERILPKHNANSRTNAQAFNGKFSEALKILENLPPKDWRENKVDLSTEQLEGIDKAYENANHKMSISTTDNEHNTSFRTSIERHKGAEWIDKWYEKYKDTIDGQWYKATYLDAKEASNG
jgi:hypothetical protein